MGISLSFFLWLVQKRYAGGERRASQQKSSWKMLCPSISVVSDALYLVDGLGSDIRLLSFQHVTPKKYVRVLPMR